MFHEMKTFCFGLARSQLVVLARMQPGQLHNTELPGKIMREIYFTRLLSLFDIHLSLDEVFYLSSPAH